MKLKLPVLLLIGAFTFLLAACEDQGGAEKAGKAIDDALDDAKEAIDEARE